MSQSLKRPRAETSTSSSLPSTRVRLEEPEIPFTLFDEAELANLSISSFDGQLSDSDTGSISSDDESDVSSPIELPDNSETESSTPSEAVMHNDVSSGDWNGTRKCVHNYRLPRTNEDLSGPVPEEFGLTGPTALTKVQKGILHRFCNFLIKHWPSNSFNPDLVAERQLALADQTTFWHVLLDPQFRSFIDSIRGESGEDVSFIHFYF